MMHTQIHLQIRYASDTRCVFCILVIWGRVRLFDNKEVMPELVDFYLTENFFNVSSITEPRFQM